MGKIIVGQKNPKRYDAGGLTVAAPAEQPKNEVAVTQQQTGQGQEMTDEMKRENRLKEILAMDESEQLPLLLAEGYEDEAKELSERLAAEQQEQTGEGTGEENTGTEAPADGTTAELNDEGAGEAPESAESPADAAPAEEPEKKKGGRPKKTESK